MKKIIVITHGYPNIVTPNSRPFVKELVETWRKKGINVLVIRPLTFVNWLKYSWARIIGKVEDKDNEFPLYCDFLPLKIFGFMRKLHMKLADRSFQYAVDRILIKERGNDYILYSHFLNAGFCAAVLAKKYDKEAYCAVGESSFWTLKHKNMEEVRSRLKNISGFISVSEENKRKLLEERLTSENKIIILPNGVDSNKFYCANKELCRKELNLCTQDIVGIFVGHFIERKGILRVSEASQGVEHLKMIYIGSGEQVPYGENIAVCKRVEHDELYKYLSAADFFILPTLAEGSCNAIIEAMSCGLPIISSIGEFNDDILNDSYAFRVEPNDVGAIHKSICELTNNAELRDAMSAAALRAAKDFSLSVRAEKILKFIGYEKE